MRMEKATSCCTVLLFVAIFAFVIEVEARITSLEIDAKLKLLNKPALKTIKSADGDIIDCVDIYKQPAFDHPALKNHQIRMRPSVDYPVLQDSSANSDESRSVISQIWQRNGGCPNGTIPIRRIRRKDLLRADSLKQFGKKPPEQFANSANTTNGPNFHLTNLNASKNQTTGNYALANLIVMDLEYMGALAVINVWNPKIDLPDDFTTAQIWLKNGQTDSYDSVEVGWMVHPKLYGDRQTRFFIYWTGTSYQSTGCFDLTCSGFVQTSTEVLIGGAFNPVSSPSGTQYRFGAGIYMDGNNGDWWLKVSPKDNLTATLGYWPGQLFTYLSQGARMVQWGGEVYSSQIGTNPHTATEMGSGYYANALFGRACYMRNLRIMDSSYSFQYPESANAVADQGNCYSALNYRGDYSDDPMFYFGGPGRQLPNCT